MVANGVHHYRVRVPPYRLRNKVTGGLLRLRLITVTPSVVRQRNVPRAVSVMLLRTALRTVALRYATWATSYRLLVASA